MNGIRSTWDRGLLSVLACLLATAAGSEETNPGRPAANAAFTLITPYEDESDMGPTREAFSSHDRTPWGFVHNGIDFFPKSSLKRFRAAAAGEVTEVRLWRNDKTSNWQVNVSVKFDPAYSLGYGFEPMTSDEKDGQSQLANILVSKGQRLAQGDPIGRLVAAGHGAHVDFGLHKGPAFVSPEPYFTPDARASVLRLVRLAWPGAQMSYGVGAAWDRAPAAATETTGRLTDRLPGGRPDLGANWRPAPPGGEFKRPRREEDDPRYAQLPDISTFAAKKSDRFIVDMEHVTGGHPYKGRSANRPHSGAHIYLGNPANAWPKGGASPANYPPIYAAADGIVTSITPTFRLTTGADRYGVAIAFARDAKGTVYRLHYAIEPFVPEPSRDFYKQFILVSEGQQVHKGDVIAYMYTPPGQVNTHICFRIQPIGGEHMAPVIFTREVVERFHATWTEPRFRNDGDDPMPPCMGYKLTPGENPFGTGPAQSL